MLNFWLIKYRDADILSDKYEDVLVNVNIVDDERHKKSMANIKAGKLGCQVRIHEIIIGFHCLRS